MTAMMTVIDDPTDLFIVGDRYAAADIYAWLNDGLLPEGLVLRNGRHLRVAGGELRPCDAEGAPVAPNRSYLPRTKTRWRVLAALHAALESGETPSYRELSDRVGVALGAIAWHLQKLEEDGLVERNRHAWRGTRTTELGRRRVAAMQEEVTR